MKNTKYLLHFYSMYDHTGIRKHLEKMAEKGWMLEKTGTFAWKYRRIEPRKIHFAVNYFPRASEFAPGPTEEQETMFEFCEKAGWKLVSTVAQIQIFCNEQENPVPIETDATVQVDIIAKAMWSAFLPAQIMLLVLGLAQMALAIGRLLDRPISELSDPMNLFGIMCWVSVIVLTVTELVNYFVWLKRARLASERDGSFVETRSFPLLQAGVLVLVLGGLFLGLIFSGNSGNTIIAAYALVYTIVLFGTVNFVKRFLRSRKFSTGVTRTLTFLASLVVAFITMFLGVKIVIDVSNDIEVQEEGIETYEYQGKTWEVYHDELPLVLEDFMDVDYDGYSYELDRNETFLVAEYEAMQSPRLDALEYPFLSYRIIKVKVPVFYNMCFKEKFNEINNWKYADGYVEEEYREHYVALDAELWQADAVYREYTGEQPWNRYLICWDDKIVEIIFPEEPSDTQIMAVTEKLKNT